jgi:septal ring factor EnvC (AmiA/AmiB activator)
MKQRSKLPQAIAVMAALTAPPAAADLWKCTDEHGQAYYTSEKADLKKYKGCQVVTAPISTVHSSRPPAAKDNKGPANFPSVSNADQKARDNDRRKILESELSSEERLLEDARKKLKEQEEVRSGNEKNFARVEERLAPFQKQVQLHESNIANIRKELTTLR